MYMQLSTGNIKPQGGKYGIENLKLIVRAAVNVGKVIAQVRANPVPEKFWGKVWYWIRGLFSNRSVFAEIGQDLVQLAANADTIKAELLDLDGTELEQLITMLTVGAGIGTPSLFLQKMPALLDAIKAFAEVFE